jgi:hypothetical protein
LPSFAAWIAARRPSGPLPMMMKSCVPNTVRPLRAGASMVEVVKGMGAGPSGMCLDFL